MPLNSSPSDDKKSTITSNERSTSLNIGTGSTEVDTDVEAQTITPRIAHVTGPERRKILYDNSPIDPETTETNDVLTRESLLRYISFHRVSRDTGEEADIRRKIFKLEVAVIGFVVVLMTSMVALAILFAKSGANHVVVASEGSNTTTVAANPTFQQLCHHTLSCNASTTSGTRLHSISILLTIFRNQDAPVMHTFKRRMSFYKLKL